MLPQPLTVVADLGQNASAAAAIIKHTNSRCRRGRRLSVPTMLGQVTPSRLWGIWPWSEVDLPLAEHIAQPAASSKSSGSKFSAGNQPIVRTMAQRPFA